MGAGGAAARGRLGPAIVMPLHDPDALLHTHLHALLPGLQASFAEAYLGVTSATAGGYGARLDEITQGPFVRVCPIDDGLDVGDQFLTLYRYAAGCCPPEQVLHLGFPDRVAFALLGPFATAFEADVRVSRNLDAPLIYQRSPAAWATHPHNYRELEAVITRAGEYLFGRALDFAWCHMALRGDRLKQILPQVRASDLSVVAELVLLLRDDVRTVEVDWLAWEDPLVLGVNAARLRAEREASPQEARKRLSYVIPMLQRLLEHA